MRKYMKTLFILAILVGVMTLFLHDGCHLQVYWGDEKIRGVKHCQLHKSGYARHRHE